MSYQLPKEVQMLIQDIQNMDHNDEDMKLIEDTMNFYCSLWDIRYGMLRAIIETIDDQWRNHPEDQSLQDITLLREKLNLPAQAIKTKK